jgi:hypothetical protein
MKPRPIGLIAAGSGARAVVAGLPALLGQLGPVKGASFPAARKLVRALRAGYAVADYSALEGCELIWIFAPDGDRLHRVAAELAPQAWLGRCCIVLGQTARESSSVPWLSAKGARLATVFDVPIGAEALILAEGHPDALARLRTLYEAGPGRLLQMPPGAKPRLLAGVRLASDLLLPFLAGSVECFRAAGLTRPQAIALTRALGLRAVRASLGGSAAARLTEEAIHQVLSQVARAKLKAAHA